MLARFLVVFLLATIPPSFAAIGAERDEVCLRSPAVDHALRDGRAARFAVIARELDGEILRTELCESTDGLVYRVTLIDTDGNVRRVVLDARSGRVVYHGR